MDDISKPDTFKTPREKFEANKPYREDLLLTPDNGVIAICPTPDSACPFQGPWMFAAFSNPNGKNPKGQNTLSIKTFGQN